MCKGDSFERTSDRQYTMEVSPLRWRGYPSNDVTVYHSSIIRQIPLFKVTGSSPWACPTICLFLVVIILVKTKLTRHKAGMVVNTQTTLGTRPSEKIWGSAWFRDYRLVANTASHCKILVNYSLSQRLRGSLILLSQMCHSLAWPDPIPHRGKGSGIWPQSNLSPRNLIST